MQALGLVDRGVGGVDGEGGGRDGGQVLDEGGVEGLEFGRCADHVPRLTLCIGVGCVDVCACGCVGVCACVERKTQ